MSLSVRGALALLSIVALPGCGFGLAREEAEPSGAWSLEGKAVSRDQVESSAGAEHCGWQQVHFLGLSWPPGRTYDDPRRKRMYVKDPKGVLDFAPYLRQGYKADADLPQDAVDTGYRNSGYALYYSPKVGDAAVYLVSRGDKVESWPKATRPVGCD